MPGSSLAPPPPGPSVAFLFEGGGEVGSALERDIRRLRHAIALDTLEVLGALRNQGALDRVVLVTDRRELAAAAPTGVEVEDSARLQPAFHFGDCLQHLLARHRAGLALVLGGAAAPLYGPEDLRRFLVLAAQNPGTSVQNNPQSPDVVCFSPAQAALTVALPDSDNALGQALSSAGLRRVLVENSARVNFDLDTPADAAILAGEPGIGPRTRGVFAAGDLPWLDALRRRLDAVEAVLGAEGAELALVGRVGPPVTGYLNMHLRCRLRVFSEERGMRALGRVAAGTVESLIGRVCDAMGPAEFFRLLRGCGDAVLFDTRVLMAHWRQPLSESDRFHADVGDARGITDARLRAFTAAAWASDPPVVTGGHTLVYGGLWLLADRVLRAQQTVAG